LATSFILAKIKLKLFNNSVKAMLFCLEKISFPIFLLLLILAIVGEAPDFRLGSYSFQQLRVLLGVNLPVTPFTEDMALLSDNKSGEPVYLEQLKLKIRDQKNKIHEVSWDYFNVYNLKHYITVFVEALSSGSPLPLPVIMLICANIANQIDLYPISWKVESFGSKGKINDKQYC
jgi:hypothetical protein